MPVDDERRSVPPGLPSALPPGEEVLWQGRPNTWALARDALSIRWIFVYFAVVAFWRVGTLSDLMPFWAAMSAAVPFVLLGVAVGALLFGMAWLQARATHYTITNARVVMKIGAALSLTLNLPFSQIESAGLDLHKSGSGTIALRLKPGKTRLSYLVCWPHVRPWRMNPTEPALRAISDAQNVAKILSDAVGARVTEASPETPQDLAVTPVAAE